MATKNLVAVIAVSTGVQATVISTNQNFVYTYHDVRNAPADQNMVMRS